MANLNYITFNQDYSSVAVATSKGFRTYTTEPFTHKDRYDDSGVSQVEVLLTTSLHALVLSPRLLRVVNTKRGATICELNFPSKINAIKMNRKRLIAVLEDSIYIYDMGNMKHLHTIDTPPNPHALCALSTSSENNLIVYPSPLLAVQPPGPKKPSHVPPGGLSYHGSPSHNTGDVRVFDATKLESVNTIQAHQSAIGCLALNSDATMLATASEKGTVIRVFTVPDGQTIFQFRRGSLPAQVFSMSFNATSTLLCVSSATETVHIFRLIDGSKISPPTTPTSPDARTAERRWSSSSRERSGSPSDDDAQDSCAVEDSPPTLERKPSGFTAGLASMLRQTSRNVSMGVASRVGGYLPASVTQALEPQRDFAHVKIPRVSTQSGAGPLRSIVAMSPNHPHLFVVTSEGVFGVYNIDLEKGGEGVLVNQFSLLEPKPGQATLEYSIDE